MAKREICGVELDEGSPGIIINTRDYHERGRIPIRAGSTPSDTSALQMYQGR